jgi:hypothetical protein
MRDLPLSLPIQSFLLFFFFASLSVLQSPWNPSYRRIILGALRPLRCQNTAATRAGRENATGMERYESALVPIGSILTRGPAFDLRRIEDEMVVNRCVLTQQGDRLQQIAAHSPCCRCSRFVLLCRDWWSGDHGLAETGTSCSVGCTL